MVSIDEQILDKAKIALCFARWGCKWAAELYIKQARELMKERDERRTEAEKAKEEIEKGAKA